MNIVKFKKIKNTIDEIFKKYHHPDYLYKDPLLCVRKFKDHTEQEVMGLIASCLSYGRVEMIIKTLDALCDLINKPLLKFILSTSYAHKEKICKDFCYRFTTAHDIALLFELIKNILNDYGSIEKLFYTWFIGSSNDFTRTVDAFSHYCISEAVRISGTENRSFQFLFPLPKNKSACKRMLLFLRWMVRENDGIDLGLWKSISSSLLKMPVDTHICRITQHLKITEHVRSDWKMVEEITEFLRGLDPQDPIKYDFSLCRFGMVEKMKGKEECRANFRRMKYLQA